jgi:hypothetical protein
MTSLTMTHRTRTFTSVMTFTLLLLVASIILPFASAQGPKRNTARFQSHYTTTPQISTGILTNPGKGWVLYGSPSRQSSATLAYGSVGYVRYDWSSIEPTEGHYNWSMIDYDLNSWVAVGKQFAFGVMNADSSSSTTYVTPSWVFNDGAASVRTASVDDVSGLKGVQYVPVWNDPIYLQKVRDFLAALAQRYDGNPHIAYIDIRSYGNWGEQHVYGISPSVALSAADVQTHIQMYRNAFQHTQLIVPWGMPDYNSVYNWAVNNGVGMRRDGMMVDSTGSELTPANGKAPAVFEFYGSYQWLNKSGYWSNDKLRQEVEIGKPSYINLGQWNNDAQMMLAAQPTLVHDLANHMGYDFVLQSATLPTTINNNQPTTLSLSWNNQGVTYLYKHAYVAIALLDSSNNVIQKQWFGGSNPNAWAPRQTTTESASFTFSGLNTNSYRIAVGLFQNQTDSNPTYQISNQGRTANGWYVISSNNTNITTTKCGVLHSASRLPMFLRDGCQRPRIIR